MIKVSSSDNDLNMTGSLLWAETMAKEMVSRVWCPTAQPEDVLGCHPDTHCYFLEP
jgi:hypothetical protein